MIHFSRLTAIEQDLGEDCPTRPARPGTAVMLIPAADSALVTWKLGGSKAVDRVAAVRALTAASVSLMVAICGMQYTVGTERPGLCPRCRAPLS